MFTTQEQRCELHKIADAGEQEAALLRSVASSLAPVLGSYAEHALATVTKVFFFSSPPVKLTTEAGKGFRVQHKPIPAPAMRTAEALRMYMQVCVPGGSLLLFCL